MLKILLSIQLLIIHPKCLYIYLDFYYFNAGGIFRQKEPKHFHILPEVLYIQL